MSMVDIYFWVVWSGVMACAVALAVKMYRMGYFKRKTIRDNKKPVDQGDQRA